MTSRVDRVGFQEQPRLALAGPLATAVLTIGVVVAGLTWPDYRHRTQNVSDLGGTEAPLPLVQNVTFVIFGLLVVAFAVAMRRHRLGHHGTGALLIGYFGATMALLGVTPCTPGCAAGTPADVVHGLAAMTGFLAFGIATLLVWRGTRAEPQHAAYGRYSAATGTVVIVFLGAWLVASGIDPEALHAGALQRLFIAPALIWLTVTGLRPREATGAPPSVADPTG